MASCGRCARSKVRSSSSNSSAGCCGARGDGGAVVFDAVDDLEHGERCGFDDVGGNGLATQLAAVMQDRQRRLALRIAALAERAYMKFIDLELVPDRAAERAQNGVDRSIADRAAAADAAVLVRNAHDRRRAAAEMAGRVQVRQMPGTGGIGIAA